MEKRNEGERVRQGMKREKGREGERNEAEFALKRRRYMTSVGKEYGIKAKFKDR